MGRVGQDEERMAGGVGLGGGLLGVVGRAG